MAYNIAMPHAFADGCDWVVWANNDIKLESGCLEQIVRAATSEPRIGVIGPAFLEWEGELPNYYMLGNHPAACSAMEAGSETVIDVEWVEGSFLMVSQECAKSVGPLDPYLFLYWEETDFCRRARHKGWRVVLAPAAPARHYAGGWSGENQENGLAANRLRSRNHYIYKLANPFSPFLLNILHTVHLFLFHMCQCSIKRPYLAFFHLRIFANVLANLPTVYRKWTRDRAGNHPPELQAGLLPVELEIMRGKSVGDSAPSAPSEAHRQRQLLARID
jgi:GT2 family glycosyltransferase